MEVVNANKQLSVSKKFCSGYKISMIKPNCHLSELQVQKVIVPMVTMIPFCFEIKEVFQCLSYLQNFILLKSVEYIKSYRYFSALC